ncbi:GntR family transcriptional regulator [Thalassotalea sp. Y01]|uniref:GntR family transcriptional regulator n=1 Tax=Thalassotalea sp. Y01 TaxID=2729613 RepID=UPI00145D4026|nr:GntR family transcriptional regulator [Thalassotalea sp. Y01]NMP16954.1 GntR family transcriptional regulator [Thalassotalea sp. Y01]
MTNINLSQPKYRQIGEQLQLQICAGRYHIGVLLPTEKQLCETYQISRHTAREALRYVEQLGLVEKRQGSGTRVINNELPEKASQHVNSVEDLLSFGNNTRFEIIQAKYLPLTSDIANQLDQEMPGVYLHITGLRWGSDSRQPLCYSILYLRVDKPSDKQNIAKDQAIYALIEAVKPEHIGSIEQHISATSLDNDMAHILDCRTGLAALQISRRYQYKNEQAIILIATSFYPQQRFVHSSVLYPSKD